MGRKKSKKLDDVVIDDVVVKKPKPKLHYVCDGVTITSKKGILISGKCVFENDLSGGKKALDALLKKGCIELR